MIIKKFINKETILYILFGVFTTIIDFVTLAVLHYVFDMNEIVANTIAWVFAVAGAYITNKLYVFESKSFSRETLLRELPSFILARVFSLVVTDIILAVSTVMGINLMIAKIFSSVFVIISNYIFSKLFIFKKKDDEFMDITIISDDESLDTSDSNSLDAVTELEEKEETVDKNSTSNKELKINNLKTYLLAFIIPVAVLATIFISREVHPFGDSIYLRSDCYHQYAPFYKELYRKLTEGGSLFYSWNIGMGVNFTALYAYYLASPINLLLGFFAINGDILLTMDVLILVKTGLAGLTFAYYLTKKFNINTNAVAAVSIFYALSSYMAAFSWNIMWIDCIVALPIIALGIERLVKEKKWLLYTLSLGFAIFSNYYIAIMICIFSVLYFGIMLFSLEELNGKVIINRCLSFAKGSLLAGGLGATTFLPAYYALSYTASANSTFPTELKNYFSILDMVSRSLMGLEPTILSGNSPNIYCTVAVFVMIPLYCLCSKVNKRERIGKLAFLAFLLVSFNMNIPNYIWHGLHFPNSLPCRESFIYIFLILTMCFEAAIHIKEFTSKQIYSSFFGAVGLIVLIEQLYVDDTTYPFEIIYTSLFFIILYLIVINLYRNPKVYRPFAIYLLFVVCISEAAINSNHEAAYKTTGYSNYLEDNKGISDVLDKISDKGFYRVEKIKRRTKNDAAWNDYHGVSVFSSTANAYFTELLGRFGFEKSTNSYSHYGSTPLSSAMLSVKYLLSSDKINDPYMMTEIAQSDGTYLYENNYVLPLGYMVNSQTIKELDLQGNDPFLIQSTFASLATGHEGLFTRLSATASGKTTTIVPETDCDLYVYVTTYVDKVSYTATNENVGFSLSGSKDGLKHRQIIHIGEVPANTEVKVTTTDSSATQMQLYAYAFNKDVFENVFADLADEGLSVESYDDTHIKGTIVAKEDGIMLTSIIYDRGWTAYVDGKEVKLKSLNDGLIALDISAGTHTIEFEYTPDGLYYGIILSILSAVIIMVLVLIDRRRPKEI